MTALPSFPVDPGTLDAIEEAIGQHVTDDRATATATTDDITAAETATPIVGLDALLEHISGWTPAGTETIHRGGLIVDVGPLYSREDVILALIAEVRRLRALALKLRLQAPA